MLICLHTVYSHVCTETELSSCNRDYKTCKTLQIYFLANYRKSLLPLGLQRLLMCVLISVMNQGQWMKNNHGEEVAVLDRKCFCTGMIFEHRQTWKKSEKANLWTSGNSLLDRGNPPTILKQLEMQWAEGDIGNAWLVGDVVLGLGQITTSCCSRARLWLVGSLGTVRS